MSICISKLTKTYSSRKQPAVHALRGIDLTIPDGSMSAIMGPSGCGKSTLLNLIAGIDLPTSGSIEIDGVDITQCSDAVRSRIRNAKIGYILQGFELIESMSVSENLTLPLFFSSQHVIKDTARIRQCLDLVGLTGYEKRLVSKLSGGQKQRIAIARALMMNPTTILADEPTGSLDSQTVSEIISLLLELNHTGCSVVIVTHDKHVAQCCTTLYTMLDGEIQ